MVVKTKTIGHSIPRDLSNGISPDQVMSNVEKNPVEFREGSNTVVNGLRIFCWCCWEILHLKIQGKYRMTQGDM